MILSAHQSAYLPWLGLLHKIARSDLFVYLDAVQFEKNSFSNRNRIKTPQGPLWLTVPVKAQGHTSATLNDLLIDEAQPWRSKHLKAIAANYRRAPHFEACFAKLTKLLDTATATTTTTTADRPPLTLADFCWQELQFWLAEFGIHHPRLLRQSALEPTGRKSDLVLDLCRQLRADQYLSGALGRDYLRLDDFSAAGIAVSFQQFQQPAYPQRWGEFMPALSVVDFWMNCGPDAALALGERLALGEQLAVAEPELCHA